MRASCIKQLHCFTEKMCVIQAFCFVTSGLLRRFAPRNDGICALTAVLITPGYCNYLVVSQMVLLPISKRLWFASLLRFAKTIRTVYTNSVKQSLG